MPLFEAGVCCCHDWADCCLGAVQAPWAGFTQDSDASKNETCQFCTEAFQIQAPRERMSDRYRLFQCIACWAYIDV